MIPVTRTEDEYPEIDASSSSTSDVDIIMDKCDFSWDANGENKALRNINMSMQKGTMFYKFH